MSFIRTVIVGTNALGQLLGGEQAVGFDDGTFAMHPFGFDGIEPGTLLRQKQGQNTHPFARGFHLLVVFTNPRAHDLTVMPGGVVPDQQPGSFALGFQFGAAPGQKLGRDVAHWSTVDKAQRHLVPHGSISRSSLPQDPITGQGFDVGIGLLPLLLDKAKRLLLILPAMRLRQRETTPPDFIQEANGPGGDLLLLGGPLQQSVASRFFCWYNASGLVIQRLARFQLIPNRLSVWRMVSMLTDRAIQPRRTHCLTSKSSVHRLVWKPKSRGGRCNTILNISAVTSSRRTVGRWWGRLDPACRAQRPCWLNAWIAWRTVCSSQERALAMLGAVSPRAEANRIWLRRSTKAFEERNPALSDLCSSSERSRTKMRGFMRLSIPHSGSPFLRMH